MAYVSFQQLVTRDARRICTSWLRLRFRNAQTARQPPHIVYVPLGLRSRDTIFKLDQEVRIFVNKDGATCCTSHQPYTRSIRLCQLSCRITLPHKCAVCGKSIQRCAAVKLSSTSLLPCLCTAVINHDQV